MARIRSTIKYPAGPHCAVPTYQGVGRCAMADLEGGQEGQQRGNSQMSNNLQVMQTNLGASSLSVFHELNDKRKTSNMFKFAHDKAAGVSELKKALEDMSDEKRHALLHEKDERGNTALHYRAKAGHLAVCKLLHSKGADITARGQNKMKPLQFAARYGDEKNPEEVWSCIEWIIQEYENMKRLAGWKEKEENYDPKEKDKYDFTILHHAIQNTNWEENPFVVEKLLGVRKPESNVNPKQKKLFKVIDMDKQGNTGLHLAAQFDKMKTHTILDIFFDNPDVTEGELAYCINQENSSGMTPLHIACSIGNHDSVKQIIEESAKIGNIIKVKQIINKKDHNGCLPINLAVASGNLDMMEVLMEKGASVTEDTMATAAR